MTTRQRIVEAADELFYRQGFEHTSFADIADAVRISRGNFYHHFKTKDEILDAVIRLRLDRTRGELDQWQQQGRDPADRIGCFIRMLITNRTRIMLYGCPVGTLSAELAKLDHVSKAEANALFELFRTWLRRQFEALGRTDDADSLALHLLGRSQGVASLANAFRDEQFIRNEVDQMSGWLMSVLTETASGNQASVR